MADTVTSSECRKALKQYFGYDKFRPHQEEVINALLYTRDVFLIMPTGGGKSICFQIPAIVLPGTCVVVSPLIALMKDQVDGLKANGVEADFINSSQGVEEQGEIEKKLVEGKIKLLYVSPEKLVSQDFQILLKKIKINLFAIDEAHCVSVWGHDFRPEYTQLQVLKTEFPSVPIIALTASADKLTRKDIINQLNLNNPQVFLSSFDRPNLNLTVLPGLNRLKFILDFVLKRRHQSGIIYCLSRKQTEALAAKLNANGIKAIAYHAGLNQQTRASAQSQFINDNIPVICATIAFGMGIDKSNVRWIIHYNLPKNIEGYYQEIGRAGRDGLASETILFYSFGDVMMLKKFAEDSGQKEVQLAKLNRMQQYAEASICRRVILLGYFGETLTGKCGNCDVCKNPPKHFDGSIVIQKALSAMVRTNEEVATGLLIDILRGSARQEIMERSYHKIKTYGAGADISYLDWQQYLYQIINLGLVEIAYDEGMALKITDSGKDVLYGKRKVDLVFLTDRKLNTEVKKDKKTKLKSSNDKVDLFEVLRALRKQIADKERIAPYLVFHDATLREMVSEKPVTNEEMMQISGVGDRKFRLYGALFINAILDYLSEHSKALKKSKGATNLETFEKYKSGKTVAQIAIERGLSEITIYGHLVILFENGYDIDLTTFFTSDEHQNIIAASKFIKEHTYLKPLFEHLEGKIEYHKIRMALAWEKRNAAQ